MPTRKTREHSENVYAAAQKWVDAALRKDDSLFIPGQPIWTGELLAELRECYLDSPDTSNRNFYFKLQDQLAGRSPQVYQLMAEVLYFHYLIIWRANMRGDTKKSRIDEVLGWSGHPIDISPEIIAGLTPGIANIGQARSSLFPFMVGFIIEFVELWKRVEWQERQRLLDDPWAFKDFAARVDLNGALFRESPNSHRPQLEAMLHLVFPDTFEGIVSVPQKEQIASSKAFAHFITDDTPDVDRRLSQIREGLEAGLERDFDFYAPDIRGRWDPSASDAWDEFIRRAKVMVDAGIITVEGEWQYKSEIGEKLAIARTAVLGDSSDWRELLRTGLTGAYHPLAWQVSDRFRKWVDASPANVQALREFWIEGDLDVVDRIGPFSNVLPLEVATRPGGFTNLVSVLLMGVDVQQYPPFKITAFTEAYRMTGYELPDRGADAAELYQHALGFLDRLIKEAAERNLNLRDHLDAQTIAYRTIVTSLPESPIDAEDDLAETPAEPPPPASDLPSLATKLLLPTGFLHEIETLLEDKKQVIFQGPPGTGKTYVAQALAKQLAGSEDRVTLVQFHPSYAYEDFVQGFRPTLRNGQAGFELRDGPLLRAAKRAEDDSNRKHFLIIDEINRGNLAKVFGELYYLLEYRDEEITLQYQADEGKKFSLPGNLYIIGTMNTADRSIALVDLALRRRFYFVEFHPDSEPVKGVLRSWLGANRPGMEWVADIVDEANKRLSSDRHAAIGPSYFMRVDLNEDRLKRIWKHSVLPYIEERLFGESDRLGDFALDKLRSVAQTDGGSPDDGATANAESG